MSHQPTEEEWTAALEHLRQLLTDYEADAEEVGGVARIELQGRPYLFMLEPTTERCRGLLKGERPYMTYGYLYSEHAIHSLMKYKTLEEFYTVRCDVNAGPAAVAYMRGLFIMQSTCKPVLSRDSIRALNAVLPLLDDNSKG